MYEWTAVDSHTSVNVCSSAYVPESIAEQTVDKDVAEMGEQDRSISASRKVPFNPYLPPPLWRMNRRGIGQVAFVSRFNIQ